MILLGSEHWRCAQRSYPDAEGNVAFAENEYEALVREVHAVARKGDVVYLTAVPVAGELCLSEAEVRVRHEKPEGIPLNEYMQALEEVSLFFVFTCFLVLLSFLLSCVFLCFFCIYCVNVLIDFVLFRVPKKQKRRNVNARLRSTKQWKTLMMVCSFILLLLFSFLFFFFFFLHFLFY